MPVKLIKPTGSRFSYNPRAGELCVVSEIKFYFDKTKHEFELDQNPHGEPKLVKLRNLTLSSDSSELQFEARYQREDTQFKLVSQHPVDKIIYRTMAAIPDSGFAFRDDEHDSVDLLFEEGALTAVSFFKRIDTKMVDFLRIIKEEGAFIQIKQRPFAKIPLNSIVAGDGRIIYKTDSEEFSYSVDVQEYIWDILSQLINHDPSS